jgi:hypothetical protein
LRQISIDDSWVWTLDDLKRKGAATIMPAIFSK